MRSTNAQYLVTYLSKILAPPLSTCVWTELLYIGCFVKEASTGVVSSRCSASVTG